MRPLDFLPMIVGRLVAASNPIRVILFGSHASGTAEIGSDLDLMVVLDEVTHARRDAVRLRRAVADLGVPVDIVVASPALLDEFGDTVGYIFKSALVSGRVVYERK